MLLISLSNCLFSFSTTSRNDDGTKPAGGWQVGSKVYQTQQRLSGNERMVSKRTGWIISLEKWCHSKDFGSVRKYTDDVSSLSVTKMAYNLDQIFEPEWHLAKSNIGF